MSKSNAKSQKLTSHVRFSVPIPPPFCPTSGHLCLGPLCPGTVLRFSVPVPTRFSVLVPPRSSVLIPLTGFLSRFHPRSHVAMSSSVLCLDPISVLCLGSSPGLLFRSHPCTIGPQPDLARHQGFQNCPPITNIATFFRCHVQFSRTRARSQNFEIITGNKFAARDKCRLIDSQKLQP